MSTTPVQDKTITRQVQSKLSSRGLNSPCRVTVETKRGEVTLNGIVQYAHQKLTAVKLVNTIDGVRRVIDHLTVKVPIKC